MVPENDIPSVLYGTILQHADLSHAMPEEHLEEAPFQGIFHGAMCCHGLVCQLVDELEEDAKHTQVGHDSLPPAETPSSAAQTRKEHRERRH